ncbi:hypothetical protein M9Y10_028481 [Tritrichomonas musculus]|uniref:Uncharacterized protein n=1 Tax=Tritrichomonas musculus TaxID=1915356 RepID=A0ABR2KKE8_9EUKA
MHTAAPSSCINHNSTSLNFLQQQIKQPIESLNSNLNGVSFIINQLNSHLLSMQESDSNFSNLDVYSTLNILNQIYDTYKPFNKRTNNPQINSPRNISEFQVLYTQFIKHAINCIKNLVLPDDIYMQIYASLTPVLCLFLKKINGEDVNVSTSDFNILIRQNEESVEAVLHFLSEEKFETLVEKLIAQFSTNIAQHSPHDLYKSIVDTFESIKQLLIPRPQKSDKYQIALSQIDDLKYKLTLYCENDTSQSLSSIFILISRLESIIKSFRLGYITKESLKSLIKYISSNDYSIIFDSSEEMPKKFMDGVLRLYLQEAKSLYKHKLVPEAFAESIDNIINSKADCHEFLANISSFFDNSVINAMNRSFSHFNISTTTTQLKNYKDCYNMYIEFLREADDFHKGSKLHFNLMKNLMIAESEVILTTCIGNTDNTGLKNSIEENKEDEHGEKIDSIIPLISEIISILNNLATQKQSKMILAFYIHVLKIVHLAFTSIQDPKEIQIIKDFLATRIPSFETIDNVLGIKQKIGDLLAMIKLYNVFQNDTYNSKTVDEIFDLREMEENFEITVIQKQRQIPETILRQLDMILPYKDFPDKYQQFTEMIGGCVQNCFNTFTFDQELLNISNCLFSLIVSLKGRFELDGQFFFDWLKIVFSMLYDDEMKKLKDVTIPKFSQIIPYIDFSFIFSKTILTLNVTGQIINQQNCLLLTEDAKEETNDQLTESFESLRLYVFSILKTLDVDICTLYIKLNDVKEKARSYLNHSYYRRIVDQMDFIELNMIVLSEIFNLTSLLSEKFPLEEFDCQPISYINYALSICDLLSPVSQSRCLSDVYALHFGKLRSDVSVVLDIVKKQKLFSPELNNILHDMIIPLVSEINALIRSFDITSLIDNTYEYVYTVLDYFNSKESDDSITPETLVSILSLNFIVEKISPKAKLFQNAHSIASILFTLFNIKQQPPQLIESYEKLKETVIASFFNYSSFDIVIFLQSLLVEKFGFIDIYQSESELGLITKNEEIEKIRSFDKYSQIPEIIPKTVDEIYELRPYWNGIEKENENSDQGKESEFSKVCLDLFEKVEKVILPFLEPNEKVASLKEENLKLMDTLREEEKRWKARTEEAENIFFKTRKSCRKVRFRIESAILDEKKLAISIEQKKKQLVELQSQIQKKEREIAFRNEKTPPEMKEKQKLQFIGTIHALRELVGPTTNDQNQINELTKKLQEMNQKNDQITKEIERIDSRHSTTREDEIDLLIMNENSNFSSSSNQENIEEENEILEKQIAETESSNERIKRKLKKISVFTSKIPNNNNNGSNRHLVPLISTNGSDASLGFSSSISRGMNFISGPDKALTNFLHSARPYCFSNGNVNHDSFITFKNSTLERIKDLMLKRQKLVDMRDGLQDSGESSPLLSTLSAQHEEPKNADDDEGNA